VVDPAAPRDPGDTAKRRVASGETGEPSDADLVSRLGAGDQHALGLLYDRYARPAYSLARRICADVSIAEDILQEVFLTLWRDPTRYNPARGRFVTWLLTVVHHKAVDAVRRERAMHRRPMSSNAEGDEWPTPPGPGVDAAAIDSILAGQVRAAVGRLPTEQRQVLTLSYFGGYTQREISTLIDVPLGTVKSRMFVAMQRLRTLLGPLVSD
jgi:RNA polymerase sigma factor (sigma-70 family)